MAHELVRVLRTDTMSFGEDELFVAVEGLSSSSPEVRRPRLGFTAGLRDQEAAPARVWRW
ncbi:MAG: hypothetical protein H6741_31145 [Alphaproteobacteria bacterium]|nr:hypothetical protein [Alphaproteobacteria bacterium]